jgi:hypothetical protein
MMYILDYGLFRSFPVSYQDYCYYSHVHEDVINAIWKIKAKQWDDDEEIEDNDAVDDPCGKSDERTDVTYFRLGEHGMPYLI